MLIEAIEAFVASASWNQNAAPFEWTKAEVRQQPMKRYYSFGYLSYSPDGWMYAILVAEDRANPHDLLPTDEEKVRLQGNMVAYDCQRSVKTSH
jgi:hypothetical protein